MLHVLLAAFAFGTAMGAPSLSTDRSDYAPGDTIQVTFAGGPANATDWVGIYTAGVTPSGNPQSLAWLYTNGTRTAGSGKAAGMLEFPAEFGEGSYAAWFLANDGYSALAGPVPFRIATSLPTWRVEAITQRHAVVNTPYSARIAAYATEPGVRSFRKAGGPAWLQLSASGDLSGTPGSADVGANVFTVALENAGGDVTEIPLTIDVFAAGQEKVPEITVMSFNSWHEWNAVTDGFEKAADAIVRSGADLIGLQESSPAQAQRMADELGWFRVSSATGSTQILSRYPVVASHPVSGIDGARVAAATIRLADSPRREVVFFNTHLDYQYYGPYAAQLNGATEASVLAENNRSQRVPQITAVLAGMADALANADATPVFLTGDFNVPSHLDWTAATAAHHGGVGPVAWPESTRVQEAGLADSFRLLHPDPSLIPGDSWSTIHKGGEPQDRIDFVYHCGSGLHPVSSDLFATEVQTTVGPWKTNQNASATVGGNSWPSDHFAVRTTYRLDAENPPAEAWIQFQESLLGVAKFSARAGKSLDKLVGVPDSGRFRRKLRRAVRLLEKVGARLAKLAAQEQVRTNEWLDAALGRKSQKALSLAERAARVSRPKARNRVLAAAQRQIDSVTSEIGDIEP